MSAGVPFDTCMLICITHPLPIFEHGDPHIVELFLGFQVSSPIYTLQLSDFIRVYLMKPELVR